jgi:hypothetical protein
MLSKMAVTGANKVSESQKITTGVQSNANGHVLSLKRSLMAFSELHRFELHPNYGIVCLGGTAGYGGFSWVLAENLFFLYCSFGVCLYSGIYCANALSDIESDRKDPAKAKKPLPSGRISFGIGVWYSITLMAMGFVSLDIFSEWLEPLRQSKHAVTRFYGCFVLVNYAYSCYMKKTRYRYWFVAFTSLLRMQMGVLVGRVCCLNLNGDSSPLGNNPSNCSEQSKIPWAPFVPIYTGMVGIQYTKERLAVANGYGKSVYGFPPGYLELLCLAVFLAYSIVELPGSGQVAASRWCVLLFGHIAFIWMPYLSSKARLSYLPWFFDCHVSITDGKSKGAPPKPKRVTDAGNLTDAWNDNPVCGSKSGDSSSDNSPSDNGNDEKTSALKKSPTTSEAGRSGN